MKHLILWAILVTEFVATLIHKAILLFLRDERTCDCFISILFFGIKNSKVDDLHTKKYILLIMTKHFLLHETNKKGLVSRFRKTRGQVFLLSLILLLKLTGHFSNPVLQSTRTIPQNCCLLPWFSTQNCTSQDQKYF